jgi:hypothetical protein
LFIVIVAVMADGMLLCHYCMLGEFFAWSGLSSCGCLVCCFHGCRVCLRVVAESPG